MAFLVGECICQACIGRRKQILTSKNIPALLGGGHTFTQVQQSHLLQNQSLPQVVGHASLRHKYQLLYVSMPI